MVVCRKEGVSVCRVFYVLVGSIFYALVYVLVGSIFYALECVLAIECHHFYAYGETS